MATIAVNAARELFEDELIDLVKKKLKKIFKKKALTIGGKRLAGVIAGLLVPEPLVSKIIAIGFGLWLVWDIIALIYELNAMSEIFEDALQQIWDAVLLPKLTGPNPPDRESLIRILRCMAGCWTSAIAEVGLLNQAWSGMTLNQIKARAYECMMKCVEAG